MNTKLKKLSLDNNFLFLDYYDYYVNQEGCLIVEKSDTCVHIIDNNYIIDKLLELLYV